MKKIVAFILAVLNIPRKMADFIRYAKAIQKAMTGNPNFTSSAAKVTALLADITTLDTLETGLALKPPTTTVQARNVAYISVLNDLRALRSDVQLAADAKPTQAAAIIKSAAMDIKKPSTPQKRGNTAKNGVEAGTILLTGEGRGQHQWQMSSDGGTSIVDLIPTSSGKKKVTGMNPGDRLWFRNRQILTKEQYGEWSVWIEIVVRLQ